MIYLHLLKPNDAKESAENAVNTCREYLEHPLGPFRTQKENETADASHELEKEKEKDKHKEKKHGAGGGSGSTAIKKKGKHAHKAKKQQELPSAEAPLKPNTENVRILSNLVIVIGST